jgi:hypothetical protein
VSSSLAQGLAEEQQDILERGLVHLAVPHKGAGQRTVKLLLGKASSITECFKESGKKMGTLGLKRW